MKGKIPKIPPGYENVDKLFLKLKSEPEEYWLKRGEKRALELFHFMSQRVPAYKDFLRKNKINPTLIRTINDFKSITPLDKNNYLRVYPLEKMCWDGNLKNKRWTIAVNSGSTGEPFYFPRDKEQDRQYAINAELYLRNSFDLDKNSTLYIDCFAMGAWIGGLFTYEAIRLLAERKKYKLSIYTPGIFKDEILKAVVNLGPKFDQIIIGGYPPFVKDVIDDGASLGINWGKYKLGFIFSAEGFTEEFREYIFNKAKIKDYYRRSLNHYGTADMGTMAHETPVCILIRKLALSNSRIYNKLFSFKRLPTFAQYFPELFFFEEIKGNLFCSGYSGLPLVRYDLKDLGGTYSWPQINKIFTSEKMILKDEIKKSGIKDTIWNLPFVYVYERSDFIVKLYGANIFPDTIRRALELEEFGEILTGKFTMITKYDKNLNQFLEINVELKRGARLSEKLRGLIQKKIVNMLLEENSEYKSNFKSNPERQRPQLIFWEYEHPNYFKPGIKQKWVK